MRNAIQFSPKPFRSAEINLLEECQKIAVLKGTRSYTKALFGTRVWSQGAHQKQDLHGELMFDYLSECGDTEAIQLADQAWALTRGPDVPL
ncbi:hypothetical protein NDU88_001964 [Pleurodeles waltl]|uniref:Uncharacterized protein n=1 Tax=Pleurodeles waltl TaxID=8319 RepID=A0AAV7NEZ3_PLEWA|nr:hypothetical protein NDU88_001964 [Pleurodeles waltl]